VALVPLLLAGCFIHSYLLSSQSTAFQSEAIEYFAFTAKGDYVFASTADNIAQAMLYNSSVNLQLESEAIRFYYRDYLLKHE
jgi:hypothetical protein